MRIQIEMNGHEDLLAAYQMLQGYFRHPEEPAAPPSERVNFPDEPVKAKRKANGATAQPVEAKIEPEAPVAPVEPEPQPEAVLEPEPEAANPFAAEAAKEKKEKAKKLSREDVNAAFGQYITAFGQSAAMSDVTKILAEHFKVSKIKDIPGSQEAFAKAIRVVEQTIETNAYNRERI